MSKLAVNQIQLLTMTAEHLQVLASSACSEVYTTLLATESFSIREVARELNRTPASVGEHISKLLDVGLIIPAGTRKRRSRTETLFIHKAITTRFPFENQSPESMTHYHDRFKSYMRSAERQLGAAISVFLKDETYFDFVTYKWHTGYLTRENALKVKDAIMEVQDLFDELQETNPENRSPETHIRLNLTEFLMPTQRESENRLAQTQSQHSESKRPKS